MALEALRSYCRTKVFSRKSMQQCQIFKVLYYTGVTSASCKATLHLFILQQRSNCSCKQKVEQITMQPIQFRESFLMRCLVTLGICAIYQLRTFKKICIEFKFCFFLIVTNVSRKSRQMCISFNGNKDVSSFVLKPVFSLDLQLVNKWSVNQDLIDE